MPQYRIELAKTGRAGCKDTVCKKEQVKINKGEIRFGSWVEIDGHGSWSWKHWGCVSGAQMLGMREECDQGDGDYDFDMVDGYDELNDEPEIQEKIRRCIKQAHIDPEDFKGDPEKNVPGAKGIRLTAKERKELEKAAAADDDDATPKKKATKKRARKADADSDDEPVAKKKKAPAKKKTAKKEESDDDVPVKAAKARKRAVKKEESDDDAPIKAAPAKKRAARKVKQESEDDEEVVKPTRGRKSKAAVKKEESESEEDKPAVKAEKKSKTTARTRRR